MEGPYGNAMTEIALALAMAFFSVMVLAMVSMGTTSPAGADASPVGKSTRLQIIRAEPASKTATVAKESRIVVYHAGRYLDTRLAAVDPGAINSTEIIILAIDPALPLAEAITARSRIAATQITVTALDERWMHTLKGTNK
jgi:hypothetical protein